VDPPFLVVKAVILPNLIYDKMRSLYNITKSSIDLPQKKGGSTVFTGPGLFVTFQDPLDILLYQCSRTAPGKLEICHEVTGLKLVIIYI